ncbi:uncharacterized protein LOC122380899 [Amphibalanus amphitrite]|uniref:uncharacterized protein LOC122380899 n=1 Tax=Amphibalanus amphitrite TaxID=1232801 RepID=UPI001C9204D0|nr:uncharacterized protein LOC122380899 [Amphibalanus amphitrite]
MNELRERRQNATRFPTLPTNLRLNMAVDWRQYLYLAMVPFPAQRTGVYQNLRLKELEDAKEVDDGTGAAMVAIGVAAHKTDYRYGDAIVVVPKELHELLCFFVEKIRPALLKEGGGQTG